MRDPSEVLAAEHEFFLSLTSPDVPALHRLLTDDFSLVALNGAILDRSSLLTTLESGQLKFKVIQPAESTVRFYGSVAVVTGRTQMSGSLGETPFTFKSRYTHVYAEGGSKWQFAAAQGTPITEE